MPTLFGVRFHNQVLLLDPTTGNPVGAVVSEAMAGVVDG